MADRHYQRQHDGEREAVGETAFHIQQMAEARRDFVAPDDRRREDRIGRTQNRADEQRFKPREAGNEVPERRDIE
jgi:hypothetical protein